MWKGNAQGGQEGEMPSDELVQMLQENQEKLVEGFKTLR